MHAKTQEFRINGPGGHLCVVHMNSKQRFLRHLKAEIEVRCSIPEAAQRLVHKTEELCDDWPLCGIPEADAGSGVAHVELLLVRDYKKEAAERRTRIDRIQRREQELARARDGCRGVLLLVGGMLGAALGLVLPPVPFCLSIPFFAAVGSKGGVELVENMREQELGLITGLPCVVLGTLYSFASANSAAIIGIAVGAASGGAIGFALGVGVYDVLEERGIDGAWLCARHLVSGILGGAATGGAPGFWMGVGIYGFCEFKVWRW